MSEQVININGVKYTEEDFNTEQSYLIKQIRSCKVQIAKGKFELDQVQVADMSTIWSQQPLSSVRSMSIST